jgi:hypothetical protein
MDGFTGQNQHHLKFSTTMAFSHTHHAAMEYHRKILAVWLVFKKPIDGSVRRRRKLRLAPPVSPPCCARGLHWGIAS